MKTTKTVEYETQWYESADGTQFFKAAKAAGEDVWLIEEIASAGGARLANGAVTFAFSTEAIAAWIEARTTA